MIFIHCTGCYVSTGGYIERVLSVSGGNKAMISKYLATCKNMGYATHAVPDTLS